MDNTTMNQDNPDVVIVPRELLNKAQYLFVLLEKQVQGLGEIKKGSIFHKQLLKLNRDIDLKLKEGK